MCNSQSLPYVENNSEIMGGKMDWEKMNVRTIQHIYELSPKNIWPDLNVNEAERSKIWRERKSEWEHLMNELLQQTENLYR